MSMNKSKSRDGPKVVIDSDEDEENKKKEVLKNNFDNVEVLEIDEDESNKDGLAAIPEE